jgi:proteasome accessory factor B
MSKQKFLQRFTLIIRCLEKGPATFEELAAYVAQYRDELGNNFDFSQRTLQRDIKEIEVLLGYVIQNELKGKKRYAIVDRAGSSTGGRRLMEAYEMVNLLNESQENHQYIFFEERKSKGYEYFSRLLFAIRSRKAAKFRYGKYQDNTITEKVVHPIALKESRGRWYLLAVEVKEGGAIRIYGLDRISDLVISNVRFTKRYKVNVKKMFEHAFGIISMEGAEPQTVKLRFTSEQGQYIKTYPLHHSQRIITDTGEELVIELNVWITYDFILELMSYGASLTALEPKELVEALVDNYSKALEQYKAKG